MTIAANKPTKHRINTQIKAKEVRLIGNEGEQLGVIPLERAVAMAREEEMDLVQVAENADPPVCRIMDYGKYKYRQRKREVQAKKKHHDMEVKQIRVGCKIDPHDLGIKLRKAREFLEENKRVQFTVIFRGREITHIDIGRNLLTRIQEELEEYTRVEAPPKMEGKRMLMTLIPKKK